MESNLTQRFHYFSFVLQTSWKSPEEVSAQSNAAVQRMADEKLGEEASKLMKRLQGGSLVHAAACCLLMCCREWQMKSLGRRHVS